GTDQGDRHAPTARRARIPGGRSGPGVRTPAIRRASDAKRKESCSWRGRREHGGIVTILETFDRAHPVVLAPGFPFEDPGQRTDRNGRRGYGVEVGVADLLQEAAHGLSLCGIPDLETDYGAIALQMPCESPQRGKLAAFDIDLDHLHSLGRVESGRKHRVSSPQF